MGSEVCAPHLPATPRPIPGLCSASSRATPGPHKSTSGAAGSRKKCRGQGRRNRTRIAQADLRLPADASHVQQEGRARGNCGFPCQQHVVNSPAPGRPPPPQGLGPGSVAKGLGPGSPGREAPPHPPTAHPDPMHHLELQRHPQGMGDGGTQPRPRTLLPTSWGLEGLSQQMF